MLLRWNFQPKRAMLFRNFCRAQGGVLRKCCVMPGKKVRLSTSTMAGILWLLDLLDALIFHYLETWIPNPETPSTTLYLSRIHRFQKHNTTGAYKIAGGSGDVSTGGVRSVKKVISPEMTQKIVKAFLDCLYAILDGLAPLAMEEPSPEIKMRHQLSIPQSHALPVPALNLSDPVCTRSIVCVTY